MTCERITLDSDDPTESSTLQSTPPQTSPAKQQRRFPSRVQTLLALISALVLSACGAEVNSQLDLQRDHSGQRLFVLTITEDDANILDGGLEAAEEALGDHTPEVLQFEGIATETDGYSATFTMPFQNLDDYQQKINHLLDVSDIPASERDMSIEIDEHPLQTSIHMEEDFYNDDLMQWTSEALISESIVSDNTTVLTSTGTTVITFEDDEVESSTSLPRVHFSFEQDRRFADIGLDLNIGDSAEVDVTMSYLISPAHYEAQNAFLDEQVQQLGGIDGLTGEVEDSGPVEPDSETSEEYRDLQATFSSAEAVASGMRVLLDNDSTTFEIHEQVDRDSPEVSVEYVGTNWSCEEICDPANLQQLDGETQYPDHWELTNEERQDGELRLEFNRGLPLDALTSTTTLEITGAVSQRFDFLIDNETQAGHEESVTEHFAPPAGTGSLEHINQGAQTLYTVTFTADDAGQLTQRLNEYFGSKAIETEATVNHGPLSGLWSTYDLDVDVSPIWELANGGVGADATFEVELPPLHTPSAGASEAGDGDNLVVTHDDGAFTISASGPTVATGWAVGIAILLLTVLITLLVRTRRAAVRAWAVPASGDQHSETKPYNIQGPRDSLTETEIYAAPPASSPELSQTTKLSSEHMERPSDDTADTGPFPDVPLPAERQQDVQDASEQPEQYPETDDEPSDGK